MKTPNFISLTEDQFDEQFGHIPNEAGGFFHDLDWTPTIEAALHERRLWTAVDGDMGETVLLSGAHYVNRFAYVIAERPHDTTTDYEVILDA